VKSSEEEFATYAIYSLLSADPSRKVFHRMDVQLLRESFDLVALNKEQFAQDFYDCLFQTYPQIQPLFANTDRRQQEVALMGTIAAIIAGVEKGNNIAPVLQKLGARHARYSVAPEHYPLVGHVLIATFQHHLQDQFTPLMRQAWREAYEVISKQMMLGAEQAKKQQERKRAADHLSSMLFIATCEEQFHYGQPQASDDLVLLSVLQRRGIEAQTVVWNNPTISWSEANVIIRSTWDYFSHLPAFMAWASHLAEQAAGLWNPFPVIRWNTHKAYLLALASRGIPIVPTIWLPQGSQADLAAIMQQHHWQQSVIKPAIGANAFGFHKTSRQQMIESQAYLDTLLKNQDVLVQPYIEAIAERGERSLIWIAGQWSHYAVSKRTITRSTNTTPGDEEVILASLDELHLAEQTLQCTLQALGIAQQALLFARVDLVCDDQEQLRLLELELIEPILYLKLLPHIAEQLADAIVQRIQGQQASVGRVQEMLTK
jgi:hemoglobin-like flavoprotein